MTARKRSFLIILAITRVPRLQCILNACLAHHSTDPGCQEENPGQWEKSHAPPDRGPPEKEITFDPSYDSINSPSRGRSRDSQLM